MRAAFQAKCENYIPVLEGQEMEEEGGISEVSLRNLHVLLKKYGQPRCVEIRLGEVVLVTWDAGCYLATGFAVGYMGYGPHSLALFGSEAGFGGELDLYDEVSLLDKAHDGVLWAQVPLQIPEETVDCTAAETTPEKPSC
jgi:hypothetical protein